MTVPGSTAAFVAVMCGCGQSGWAEYFWQLVSAKAARVGNI